MTTAASYGRALQEKRWHIGFGLAAVLVQSLSIVPIPLFLKYAIDDAIPNRSTNRLLAAAAGIVLLSLVTRVSAVASQHWIQTATKHATMRLRKQVAEQVFRADFSRLGDLNGALLHERMIGDAGRVEGVFTMVARILLPNVLMVCGLLVLLFVIDPFLTVVSAALIPVTWFTNRMFRPLLKRSLLANQLAFEALSKRFLLTVRAQGFMRARGTAGAELDELSNAIQTQAKQSASRVTTVGISQAVIGTLAGIASAVTLVFSGQAVIDGRISVGSMLSFFAGFALLRGPVAVLASCSPQFIEGRQSLHRLDSFLNEAAPAPEQQNFVSGSSVKLASLSLEAISFGYPGAPALLADFSIDLRPGRIIALAGPNGSGKTTVLGLLLGLLVPDSGNACANGIPLNALAVDLNSIREQVGVAFQHAEFLPGTVASNVQYGRSGLREADLAIALHEAEANVVVAGLHDGVETWIGEDGDRLSGGERQRLAIARAIIGRPPVVILDEPNNHLPDTVIERILARLANWERPPAVLLISHDASVLRLAHEIVRLGVAAEKLAGSTQTTLAGARPS